jgi:hypothetical protein
MALLIDLTPRSRPSHRTHNEEPGTLVAALHADLLAVAVVLIRLMLYQTTLAASSSPWWRFPSRAEALLCSAQCGDAISWVDDRLPSPMCRGFEVCWELCCRMPRRRPSVLHYTVLPLATRAHAYFSAASSISTHTAANPATDVSSTLLGNLGPINLVDSKGRPFAQLPDL